LLNVPVLNLPNRHWVDKNCINWAKTYFETELSNVGTESNGNSVKTLAVTSVTGDVDVNQRKGKIITIFDVAITLTFEGIEKEQTEAKRQQKQMAC
jgi:activator of HSP90 ATPase